MFRRYHNMKDRCYNLKGKAYKDYGARGITVCREWLEDPLAFEAWALSSGYAEGLTLDRRDNDKGYYPSNCRWVGKSTQTQNTRQLYRHNTSGFRGVTVRGSRFQARIRVKGKQLSLGMHDTAEEAADTYNTYVINNNLEHTLNL